MSRVIVAFVWLALSASVQNVAAEQYEYFPGAPGLGHGFDKSNPARPLPDCLDLTSAPPRPNGPVGSYNAKSALVTDRSDLYSALHIDVSVSARSVAASGKANAEFEKSTQTKSNSTSWTVVVYQDFGTYSLGPEKFLQEVEKYRRTASELVTRCGKEYVKSVQLASQLTLVFSATDLTATESSLISSSMEGGFSGGVASVSITANLRSTIKQVSEHHAVQVAAYGFGAGGIQTLSGAITNAGDLDALLVAINTFLKENFTPEKAFPIRWFTGDMGLLALRPIPSRLIIDKPGLASAYLTYVDSVARYTRLQEIVQRRESDFGYLRDAEVAEYRGQRDTAKKEQETALRILRTCLGPNECPPPPDSSLYVHWPSTPEPSCKAWDHGTCYECRQDVFFTSERAGREFQFSCRRMPSDAIAHVEFDGYVVITERVPDNKVWNAWIVTSLKSLTEPCSGQFDGYPMACSDARVSPGLGTNGPVTLDWQWKRFKFHGATRTSDNIASAIFSVDHCQTGSNASTCDTAPPGVGSSIDTTVVNHGFPAAETTRPPATIRFWVRR